jgi:hypothetical protein
MDFGSNKNCMSIEAKKKRVFGRVRRIVKRNMVLEKQNNFKRQNTLATRNMRKASQFLHGII